MKVSYCVTGNTRLLVHDCHSLTPCTIKSKKQGETESKEGILSSVNCISAVCTQSLSEIFQRWQEIWMHWRKCRYTLCFHTAWRIFVGYSLSATWPTPSPMETVLLQKPQDSLAAQLTSTSKWYSVTPAHEFNVKDLSLVLNIMWAFFLFVWGY